MIQNNETTEELFKSLKAFLESLNIQPIKVDPPNDSFSTRKKPKGKSLAKVIIGKAFKI